MRLKPQSMRLTDDGVLIEGSHGSVLLRQTSDSIKASYQGKSHRATESYIQNIKETALETARTHPFPWSTKDDGSIRIDNHSAFYDQTFNANLEGIETLRLWSYELIQRNL